MTDDIVDHRRLVIAGTGISGLSAAIYAARSNNDPLLIEGDEPGGQLTLTTEVENYPGFPEGISGPGLINDMKEQAKKFGAEARNGVIEDVSKEPAGHFRVALSDGDVYTADAVIAASGASARTLGVPGEDELMGYGLSTCATCDGAFFRDEDMLVVGGGDAAMEEANFLTKFADTVSSSTPTATPRRSSTTPRPPTRSTSTRSTLGPSSTPSATRRTRTSSRGQASRPTTTATSSPRAAAAAGRPAPASTASSARATWSTSTTSRQPPRAAWA